MVQEVPYTIPVVRSAEGGKVAFCSSIAEVGAAHRRWIAGPFVKMEDGEPLTEAFEVQVSSIPAGTRRDEWTTPGDGECLTVVLAGLHEYHLLVDGVDHEYLIGAGQSLLHSNSIPHRWVVREDLSVIAIRTKA